MRKFTNVMWESVTDKAAVVFNYSIAEKAWLKNNKIAKVIVATPYIAESLKPEVVSFSHLSLYLVSCTEIGKTIFIHKEADDADIYSRLFPITNFLSGDKDVIQTSNDLLALCMISNYKKDSSIDEKTGKYNPVALGKWDYDELSRKLKENILKNKKSELTELMTIDEATKGIWS